MTHTPAPWRVAGKGTIRAGDGWIGSVHWRNREANARLIAAAPELLAALEAFNLKEEWIVSGTADTLTLRVPIAVIQQAAAAIARAKEPT